MKDKIFRIDESTQYIKTMPHVKKLDNFTINQKTKKCENGSLGAKINIYLNSQNLFSENEEEIEDIPSNYEEKKKRILMTNTKRIL